MRQILYTSLSTVPGDGADLAGILQQSRHNNAIDGVTGLLWSDGVNFMQVIEGPDESIEPTWTRILSDHRHRDIHVVRDTRIGIREFGDWTMAHRRAGETTDLYDARVRGLLSGISPPIGAPFLAMVAATRR